MSLANLQEMPETENQWSVWTFAARTEITKIRQAIQAQKGIILNEYCIDPLSPPYAKDFLQNVNRMSQDFSAALGLQAEDLTDTDFNNKEKFGEWVNSFYQQVYSAEQQLGI